MVTILVSITIIVGKEKIMRATMNISESILTINSINDIGDETLDKFMKDGFAYVKTPDSLLVDRLLNLEKVALRFFTQPKEVKEKYKRDPVTLYGYADKRREGRKKELVEQMTFNPKNPIGLFTEYKEGLNEIHQIYYFQIVKPLLRAIFNKVLKSHGFSAEKIDILFSETTDEIFFLMSVLFYPYSKDPTQKDFALSGHIVQPAHVDESLITVLWVAEEGLQAWLGNDHGDSETKLNPKGGLWHNINPKPGHVIINAGKALSLILSGRCSPVLHRVFLPMKDRLSIGVFYNPPATYKMRDIIKDKELFSGSYAEYIKDYFSKNEY